MTKMGHQKFWWIGLNTEMFLKKRSIWSKIGGKSEIREKCIVIFGDGRPCMWVYLMCKISGQLDWHLVRLILSRQHLISSIHSPRCFLIPFVSGEPATPKREEEH